MPTSHIPKPPAPHRAKAYITASPTPTALTRTITSHPFNHTLTLLLPASLGPHLPTPALQHYTHLRATAATFLLTPAIFPAVRIGKLTAISRGRLDIDNIITVHDGVIRMALDRAAYERVGLQGKIATFGNASGKKGRRRWVVEVDCRGEGFEGGKMWGRVERALGVVGVGEWVVAGVEVEGEVMKEGRREVGGGSVMVPGFKAPERSGEWGEDAWREWALEVYEWLGMAELGADRLRVGDSVDPLLSCYAVGDAVDEARAGEVMKVQYKGVLTPGWIEELWRGVEKMLEGLEGEVGAEAWVGMTVHGFENVPCGWANKQRGGLGRSGDGYTLFSLPREQGSLMYELVGGQEEYS